jgi:hypothetical protein
MLDDLPRHQELALPELALFLDGVAQTVRETASYLRY